MFTDSAYMTVKGVAGCGKSALLANWLNHRKANHPEEIVLYHFVGSAEDTTGELE